jgi:hypothetical protein
MRGKLLGLDLDLRFSAPVKPKLCMAAIAGLALVNRYVGKDAAEPSIGNSIGEGCLGRGRDIGHPIPPQRSPRAALPHEALILDEWRQSEC